MSGTDEVRNGVGLWTHIETKGEQFDHAFIKSTHSRRGVMNILTGRELNGSLNDITAKHAQRVILGLINKSRTNYNIARL